MTRRPRKPAGEAGGVEWDGRIEEPILGGSVDDATPFNPLDTKNLAIAVTKALLERKARPLGDLPVFQGAGIYAIYYTGSFEPYRVIAAENRERDRPTWPIYVGKAIPPGGRKGAFNLAATDTTALHNRLREHAESVTAVDNLALQDFSCRFLVVQDLWIPLAEGLMISHFAPVWNKLIDGFGNHDPGAGRYAGQRPRWDVLHPGRRWAGKCAQRLESEDDIRREVVVYLEGAAIPSLRALDGDFAGK